MEQPAAKKPRTGRRSLPFGAKENNRFCAVFIPTYERWVRTQANPWVICANNCVSIANIMFEQFFECKDYCESFEDYDTCQDWAQDLLADLKFVWQNMVSSFCHLCRTGLMHAPFILQVFATHLNSTIGATEVPALRATGVNKGASIVAKYPPKGALALAAAAVERSLKLWADGDMEVMHAANPMKKQANKPSIKAASKLNLVTENVSKVTSKFSAENWGAKTSCYFQSINKMKLESLEEVVQLATPFMSPSKTRCQGCSYEPQSLVEDGEDIRACLVDN
ncbi:hypothetical protein EDB86DRAFT_2809056 [Lactarius hatsudake]|nr:hypothetical protein EDB86DRAFT_2809056 [Lactarius hatsudake]